MNDRERFVACLTGEAVDRPPYWLYWGPWGDTTWERWAQDGKPEAITDFNVLRENLGADRAPMPVPVNTGPCPRIESVILEETDEYVIHSDNWGITRKNLKHRVSMPQFLSQPVKDRRDWERFKEERLDPNHPERLSGNWREQCAQWMARGYPIQLGEYPDSGVYGTLRWLLGDEESLIAFYTMPYLVRDIMDHMTTLYLTVFEKVVAEVQVDVVHMWEDMSYCNGPLISPRHCEEFMGPHYRRIADFTHRHGIPLFSVDTDGDPTLLIEPMMRAGVNFMFPMEVAAGCDVNVMQERYPTLGMMGGIDKRVLSEGPEEIDRELERIRPAVERGRYIPALDHLIPDNVSWDNYLHYARALRSLVTG